MVLSIATIGRETSSSFIDMRYLFALGLGAIAGLSFQLQFPLVTILITLISMFMLTSSVSKKQWVVLWTSFGLLQFIVALFWLDIVGLDIVLAVSMFCLTPIFLASLISSYIEGRFERAIFFVLTLTLFENVRDSFPFGGFGWLQYGLILIETPFAVIHRVLPQLLVTLIVLYVAAFIGLGIQGVVSRKTKLASSLLFVAISSASLINPVEIDLTEKSRIVAAQGGVERYGLGVLGARTEVLQNHVEVSKENIGTIQNADLVVWPENSLDIDPKIDSKAAELLAEIDALVSAPILLGAVLSPTTTTRTNTTLELNDGIREIYTKKRLVPFGEFLPLRDFASGITDRTNLLPYDFIPGSRTGIWEKGELQVSIGICFEVADAFLIHQSIENSDLVLIQTNNATYQFSNQSEQQLLYAKVRSIETGRPLVSISTSGVSALISEGQILQELSKQEVGVLNFEIQGTTGKTITSTLAPYAGWMVFTLWVGAVIALIRRRQQ